MRAGALRGGGDGIQALIEVTHFTHPGCPWAYSAWPGHTTLRWRYGVQLRWTLVVIGLTEDAAQYAARGYTPTRSAIGYGRFRRFAMRFQITPKARLSATAPACRAIVATRLAAPPLEDAALRALQFAQFTTTGRRAPDRAAVPRARLRRGA
jgi:protein-disulfide isomerase-like protein with CxxC motif